MRSFRVTTNPDNRPVSAPPVDEYDSMKGGISDAAEWVEGSTFDEPTSEIPRNMVVEKTNEEDQPTETVTQPTGDSVCIFQYEKDEYPVLFGRLNIWISAIDGPPILIKGLTLPMVHFLKRRDELLDTLKYSANFRTGYFEFPLDPSETEDAPAGSQGYEILYVMKESLVGISVEMFRATVNNPLEPIPLLAKFV